MKNWTKWYKQTLDKAREKNKEENAKIEGMSEREKATWELLMKQYGLTEEAISDTQDELKKSQLKNQEKLRTNELGRILEKSKVRESVNTTGKNNYNAEETEKKNIDKKFDETKDKIQNDANSTEDELTKKLRTTINDIEENSKNKIKSIDERYDKTSSEKYKTIKNRIDYLLNYNDTGSGDIYFNIKDTLLDIIDSNKESLTEEKYNELKNYVNSKIYIDNDSMTNNVTLYVNDKQLTLSVREFEWSTKITYNNTNNFIGMVYGELINVNYNGKSYKVKVQNIASTDDVEVVKAIAKRKKLDLTIGTCISYNGKIYIYSGDKIWRYIGERGGANYNDGYAALLKQYNNDIYNDAYKKEEE